MATGTYVLSVDWNNNDSFADAEEDITSDLISVECKRGRDYASQLTGRATAGRLIATLVNTSGKYSSFNTGSAIAGNIVPGRKVKLTATAPSAVTIWTGFLQSIKPSAPLGGYPTVILEAVGAIGKLGGKQISPAAQANQTTGTIIGAILDAAGWPVGDRILDTGQTTISRWFVDDKEVINAVRDVEETELGWVYEGLAFDVVFEDRHHRLKSPHTASQATFSDAAGAARGYRGIEQEDPWREIYNEAIATVVPMAAAGASSVLWTLRNETPAIFPGETKTFWASYPNVEVGADNGAYVETWDDPVVGVDITQTGIANGELGLVVYKFAQAMKITLTNNGAATCTITLMQAQGDPVTRQEPVKVDDEDTTSQTAYGERTFRLPGPWLPDTDTARDFVRYLVSRYKDPLPIERLEIRANTSDDLMTEALTRAISDRITLVATGSNTQLGINDDFFIEAISHRITHAGKLHDVVFELSDASGDGGWWTIGISELGINTRLAY